MGVSGDMSLPIGPRDREWNGSQARRRVIDKYTSGGKTNWSKVRRAFFWIDEDKADQVIGYNLGFADVVDGELKAIPRGLFAVAGGHGVTRIQAPSASEKNAIKRKVNAYYRKMKVAFPNDDFAFDPPFPDVKTLDMLGQEIDDMDETEKLEVPDKAKEVILEVEQKFYPMMSGATSFAELESLESVRQAIGKVFKTVHQFESLAYSIARQSSTPSDLVSGLKSLTKEMTTIFDNMDFSKESEETEANDKGLTTFINTAPYLNQDWEVKQFGSTAILKGKDSQLYFYGRFTNNIWDREDEVLLNKAHEEFASYLDDNPDQMPELWDWHEQATAKSNRAVWHDYADGFLHMIWPITKDEAKGIEAFAKEFDPGMSHGFEILERDKEDNRQIAKYRTFEASILPLEDAANEWTTFEILDAKAKENKMISPKKRRALELLSLGKYSGVLDKASEEDAAAIDDAGVPRATKGTIGTDHNTGEENPVKGKGTSIMENQEVPKQPDVTPVESPVVDPAPTNATEIKAEDLIALQSSIVEGLQLMTDQIKGIAKRLTSVEDTIKGIKETKGQSPSVAAWVAAQKAQTSVGPAPADEVDNKGNGELADSDPLLGRGPTEAPYKEFEGHLLNGL